jgi:bacterioferritin (cytochrome b1)
MTAPAPKSLTRRDVLLDGSKLSLASLGLLAGFNGKVLADAPAAAKPDADATTTTQEIYTLNTKAQDITILNAILGMEHTAIANYQICIDKDVLQKGTLRAALIFKDHHIKHRDLLIEKITNLGGSPVSSKKPDDYVTALKDIPFKTQQDALELIVKMEFEAANTYIGALSVTGDREFIKTAARVAADDVLHWTIMSGILHRPLPEEALSFGA